MLTNYGSFQFLKCDDFEKVVFGWQHILRYFELGKPLRIIANSDPDYSKITLLFLEKGEDGAWKGKQYGSIWRPDCERFFAFCGWNAFMGYEAGEKQRIIMDYDPLGRSASIEIRKDGCGRQEFQETVLKYFPDHPAT